jgi:hypothetical protein
MGVFEAKGLCESPSLYPGCEGYNIRAEISQIPQNMLQKMMNGVRRRVELRLNSGGEHLSDVIFKE